MTTEPTYVRRTCNFCGVTFWTRRSDAQYCTNAHRQKAYRWRTKLPATRDDVITRVHVMAQYLDYEDAKPYAVKYLVAIQKEIARQLDGHGVQKIS